VLLYCGSARPIHSLIQDKAGWEEFTEEAVDSYLAEGADMLVRLVREFASPKARYSSATAKELRFMLEALIEVKETFRNPAYP
jgi:hypothetical protein